MFHIDANGWTQRYAGDMNEIYYKDGYKAEMERPANQAAPAGEQKMQE